jgi:hypothetical protein
VVAIVIHICAIVLVSGVGLSTGGVPFRSRALHLAILAAGGIGGVAMAVSGLYLLDDWGASMEHFDFATVDHTNPRRFPSSLYLLPSSTMALGAVAALYFGWRLYRSARELE